MTGSDPQLSHSNGLWSNLGAVGPSLFDFDKIRVLLLFGLFKNIGLIHYRI